MPTTRKRGRRWQAQVRVVLADGTLFAKSATFDTERAATAWGKALEVKVASEGQVPYLQGTTTVADLMVTWSKDRPQASRGIQHSLNVIMASKFAQTSLRGLTAKTLVDWAQSQTTAPATRLHHFMILRSAMNSSQSLLGVPPNMEPIAQAMDHLRRLRVTAKSRSRDRRVTDAEIDLLCEHLGAKALLVPTDTFVRLAVAMPRRREELLTMLWDDYSPSEGTLRLRDTKHPTSPRDELIPVPPAAQAILATLHRIDERILPYKPESVSAAFQRAVLAVGLEDLRLHDLRHEGISRLFEQGLQIQEVALISGHVSWAALRRYTHIKPSSVLEKLAHHARIQKAQKAPA